MFEETQNSDASKTMSRSRNRRVYERHSIEHKNLTIYNDQDILPIREISAKGFSTKVSKRGSERFVVGDVYEANMRFQARNYTLEIRVSWKDEESIGFELMNSTKETLTFMQKLLKPIEIGNSLKKVNSEFLSGTRGKVWFHGNEGTDLFIWSDHAEKMIGWQLSMDKIYAEWNSHKGLETGKVEIPGGDQGVIELPCDEPVQIPDAKLNSDTLKFAEEIISSMKIKEAENILPTLTE